MREAVTRPRRSSPHIMQHCPFRPDFGIPMLSFNSHRHRLLISAPLTTYNSMCRQKSHSGRTFVPNIAFAMVVADQGAAKAGLTRQQIMASEHVSDWTWKSGQIERMDSNVVLHLVRRATSCTQGSWPSFPQRLLQLFTRLQMSGAKSALLIACAALSVGKAAEQAPSEEFDLFAPLEIKVMKHNLPE